MEKWLPPGRSGKASTEKGHRSESHSISDVCTSKGVPVCWYSMSKSAEAKRCMALKYNKKKLKHISLTKILVSNIYLAY